MQLDAALKEQLKTHFAQLQDSFKLSIDSSSHEKQSELQTMLSDVASCSDKIEVTDSSETCEQVRFELLKNDSPTGISFRAVPGGHEFTSLILALLNADGKGKLPDEGMQNRIRSLKGPIRIRTYMSLSCETCPDVVQALNQMALIHGDFHHETVDGGLVAEEVAGLSIQGVPAVFYGDELVHSGRGSFAELLEKLEATFGAEEAEVEQSSKHYDVVVIGGGPAGASAAIYTARKGLTTALVAEKMGGQVIDTKGIENLISVVYTEGPQLSAKLEEHMRAYEIDILEHRRVERVEAGQPLALDLSGGEKLTADSLIVATGANWRELNIPGEKDYSGRGVAYCPHCDGPYYKDKEVAVVGGGNSGVEAAIDLAGICSKVTLIEYLDELKADAVLVNKLESLTNVTVMTGIRTTEVKGNGETVSSLAYEKRADGSLDSLALDGIFVQIGLSPNSAFISDVVEVNKFGEIVVDEKNRTNVAGIYAAGDVTTVAYKQIVISIGEGAKAALAAFEDRMRTT